MQDFRELTLEQLAHLRKQIDDLVKIRQAEKIVTARRQILSIANDVGVPVEAILGAGATLEEKAVSGLLQHPERPELIWKGRGRRPNWMKELVDSGKLTADLKAG